MDPNQLTEKQHHEIELREQDRWLPIANVARLMKNTLPATAKVSKDAKECMQECVSEFISFITSEASDKCVSEKRKTINGEDILFAMSSLGFENYGEVLKIYLAKYREQQVLRQERKESKRKPSKQDVLLYDQEQQLQREMTNIPFNEEDDMDMNSQIHNEIMHSIEDDGILNLNGNDENKEERDEDEDDDSHPQLEQEDQPRQGHYDSNPVKEEDPNLYQYTEHF